MNERESQSIIRMVESHFQTNLGDDGRSLWASELRDYDPDMAVKAVAWMAKHPLPNNRSRPLLSDYRAVYLKIARDAEQPKAIIPPTATMPEWVRRWQRARAAGDERPFPAQAPGYEVLRRGSPLNRVAYALPHVAHTSREHWVQDDEYLFDKATK